MSECCLRDTSRTSKNFLTKETLNIIEDTRGVRIEGRTGQYRELKREAVCAVTEGSPWGPRDSGEPLVVNRLSTSLQRNTYDAFFQVPAPLFYSESG